jgi:hypothetical protein
LELVAGAFGRGVVVAGAAAESPADFDFEVPSDDFSAAVAAWPEDFSASAAFLYDSLR